jgi:hypothetical protein
VREFLLLPSCGGHAVLLVWKQVCRALQLLRQAG